MNEEQKIKCNSLSNFKCTKQTKMTEGKWPIIYFVVCLLMFLINLVTVVENYVVIINIIC